MKVEATERGCPPGGELARFVDGEWSRNEEAAFAAHMEGCARCRVGVEELKGIAAMLGEDPPGVEADLTAAVLRRASLPPPRKRIARFVPVFAAAAAGLAVGIAMQHNPGATQHVAVADEGGFQARGGGENPDRWVAIHAYVATDGGKPRPLAAGAAVLGCNVRLLFAYDNAGPHPYPYLTIVGSDEAGQSIWFYPEHPAGAVGGSPASPASPGSPGSIDAQGGRDRELPDEIPVAKAGRLVLRGLWSERRLGAAEVEAALRGHVEDERLPIPRTGQHRVELLLEGCEAR